MARGMPIAGILLLFILLSPLFRRPADIRRVKDNADAFQRSAENASECIVKGLRFLPFCPGHALHSEAIIHESSPDVKEPMDSEAAPVIIHRFSYRAAAAEKNKKLHFPRFLSSVLRFCNGLCVTLSQELLKRM